MSVDKGLLDCLRNHRRAVNHVEIGLRGGPVVQGTIVSEGFVNHDTVWFVNNEDQDMVIPYEWIYRIRKL